jgi:hypothetical protein
MSTFKTTAKGLTFLQAYNQIDKMLKEQQQDLDAIERENR